MGRSRSKNRWLARFEASLGHCCPHWVPSFAVVVPIIRYDRLNFPDSLNFFLGVRLTVRLPVASGAGEPKAETQPAEAVGLPFKEPGQAPVHLFLGYPSGVHGLLQQGLQIL